MIAQSMWLRAAGWTVEKSVSDSWHGQEISLFSTVSKTSSWADGVLSLGLSDRGVNLIIHLHLLPRLGMLGAIPPFLQTS